MAPAQLDLLDSLKTRFSPAGRQRLEGLLARLARARFRDPASLIRLHEILLFIRAFPASAAIRRSAEALLAGFSQRIRRLDDLCAFEEPEVSGIAGTSLSGIFSYPVARWLAQRHPRHVRLDWERFANEDRLGMVLPEWLRLAEEDAAVEPDVPWSEWVDAARGRQSALQWLLTALEHSPRAYDLLRIPVEWKLEDSPAARTYARLPVRSFFYHRAPLLGRRDVSLDAEISAGPLPMTRVPPRQAATVLALARDTSASRYRELHGFTFGDPDHMWRAEFGRGVEVFVWGIPPAARLPIRAYHCGMMFKNGVPLGYVEGLSLFERMETGFNLYYTFRDGETAWLYARLLRLLRQWLGVTCFSVDPYQIGRHNPEAIESGAFWFYRKLGFRPATPGPAALLAREERRMMEDPKHRSTPATLRQFAEGPMIYESPGTPRGDWDRFQVRNLGLTATRAGAAGEPIERVFALIDRKRWSRSEEQMMHRVLRARQAPEESAYLLLMQRHPRLREAILKLGSASK